jgi:hypothetical protein
VRSGAGRLCPSPVRPPLPALALALAGALPLTACGSATRHPASPAATVPVQVIEASFPDSQRLAEKTWLVIAVRNVGARPLPDVAVTITDPAYGTGVAAFATYVSGSGLASHSRAVWIVDQPPGPCGFSCRAGGAGGAPSAHANTWALGALRPGATATFRWGVTAVQAGTYRVRYTVAAALDGSSRALLPDGRSPSGTFTVTIHAAPVASYITPSGQITTTP